MQVQHSKYSHHAPPEIKREYDSATISEKILLKEVKHYLESKPAKRGQESQEVRLVVEYLKGKRTVESLLIVPENASDYLKIVKAIDLAQVWIKGTTPQTARFVRSTYAIRTHILQKCAPCMKSVMAFTNTFNLDNMSDPEYLKKRENWVQDRVDLHARIISLELGKKLEQSVRIEANYSLKSRYIAIVAGIPAAGKTTFIYERFNRAKDSNGYLSILSVDELKPMLIPGEIDSNLVHDEASFLFRQLLDILLKHDDNPSFLLDCCMLNDQIIETCVIKPSVRKPAVIELFEIKVDPETCYNRMLTQRDPLDPSRACVPYDQIVKKIFFSQDLRLEHLSWMAFQHEIKSHQQYYFKNGRLELFAQKIGSETKVFLEDVFDSLKRGYTIRDLQLFNNVVIDKKYIEKAIARGDITQENRHLLEKWLELRLKNAMHAHLMRIDPSEALRRQKIEENQHHQLYGSVCLEPFTGTWLPPSIKTHVDAEHRLHVRGVDEDGNGITWSAKRFCWTLNPEFNPEWHGQGGFQMKLGYFIIPDINARTYEIGPSVAHNHIKFSMGGKVFYRFFVHPEAYDHFKVLHDIGGYRFVKPFDSTYMATPTSSYRSLVVADLAHMDFPPFIVKLGVLDRFADTFKLLPGRDIEKSLSVQKQFDKIRNPSFFFFRETFGFRLNHGNNYPPYATCDFEPKDSGMIIREFPKELLQGHQIFSFSSMISTERLKNKNEDVLPLIYSIMQNCIEKKLVSSPKEFVRKYIILPYLKVVEEWTFKRNLSLALTGLNLCWVIKDNIPVGFAYRDNEGVSFGIDINTHTLMFRPEIFFQILNLLTEGESFYRERPIPGAPALKGGFSDPSMAHPDRNVHYFIKEKLKSQKNESALRLFDKLTLTKSESNDLRAIFDANFLVLLSYYFKGIDTAGIYVDNVFPGAEKGTEPRALVNKCNDYLAANSKSKL